MVNLVKTNIKKVRTMTTFTTQDRQDAQRVPLTDEKIMELAAECREYNKVKEFGTGKEIEVQWLNCPKFARAIERAHGIGE